MAQWLIYLSVTLSLVYVGEYSSALVFQFVFLLSFYKKLLYFIYLPFLHLALVKIFSSMVYPLYFLSLFIVFFWFYSENNRYSLKTILFFLICLIGFFLTYLYFEDYVYELYIFTNIEDTINYIDEITFYILTLLHTLILFFLNFKK